VPIAAGHQHTTGVRAVGVLTGSHAEQELADAGADWVLDSLVETEPLMMALAVECGDPELTVTQQAVVPFLEWHPALPATTGDREVGGVLSGLQRGPSSTCESGKQWRLKACLVPPVPQRPVEILHPAAQAREAVGLIESMDCGVEGGDDLDQSAAPLFG